MEGPDGTPLFVIDRVGDGRVAMLMSDQAWLWAKGYEGGGPYQEMFRRTAHWLLGEPDLDAETLTARAENDQLTIERRTLDRAPETAQVILPNGTTSDITMTEVEAGYYTGSMPLGGLGAYRLGHGDLSTIAAVGMLNPIEYAELLPTMDVLAPLSNATGGATRMLGLSMDDLPEVRRIKNGSLVGSNWIGVRDNDAYTVTRSKRSPLAPPIAFFLAFFVALAWGWWREAK